MSNDPAIFPDFPFDSRYVEVLGSRMHYVESGDGKPILLLHGNPTSCYLWRNIIPHLKPLGRVIAVDLIGMGKSDKPDIAYRFVDHARYLDAFIASLDLRDIVLVMTDWGSALGFHYAARNPDNVRAVAFMEAIVSGYSWKQDFSLPERFLFKMLRDPRIGSWLIQKHNFFIEQALPMFVNRKLSEQEMNAYRAPFPDYTSRKPIQVWPNEVPIDRQPEDVLAIVLQYRAWLEGSEIPKLMLWAKPGAVLKEKAVHELESKLSHLKSICIGKGKSYLQENEPNLIGHNIANWLSEIGLELDSCLP